MNTMAIRDLKNNPTDMVNMLEKNESVFITKHGSPIGITLPLNDEILSIGVKKAIALELYKSSIISVGKLSELLSMRKSETIKLLNDLNIEWIEGNQKTVEEEISHWL